ncbi:hypothetical protein [Photorhabdus caribbeanensis]|uniref:hypothetical protein n=1 Tax=Photorhabdus caribbeanensis TaxID=1004165 RepID=UPI001FEA1091|nr:hypothetical protein [Photorhabdus caribbeanensis]
MTEHIEDKDKDKDKDKTITITQTEINALKKLIMYIKFSYEENEPLQYASSYSINSFLDKLIDIDCFGSAAIKILTTKNLSQKNQ